MRINSRGKRRCPNFKSGHAGLMSEGDGDRFIKNEYLSGCEYTEYFFDEEYDLERFLGDNFSRSYVPNEGQEGYGYIRETIILITNKTVDKKSSHNPYMQDYAKIFCTVFNWFLVLPISFIAMKRAERSLYHIRRPVIWVTLIPKGRYVNENIIT